MNTYREFLDENYSAIVSDTVITASSAVRDASNRTDLNEIKVQTGWTVTLLSGDEEARVIIGGHYRSFHQGSLSKNMVIDIGGGSTEIAVGIVKILSKFESLNMVSVRFTERFLKHNQPTTKELESARKEACDMLSELAEIPEQSDQLVGVAGTVTSMAGIELGLNTTKIKLTNIAAIGILLKR